VRREGLSAGRGGEANGAGLEFSCAHRGRADAAGTGWARHELAEQVSPGTSTRASAGLVPGSAPGPRAGAGNPVGVDGGAAAVRAAALDRTPTRRAGGLRGVF